MVQQSTYTWFAVVTMFAICGCTGPNPLPDYQTAVDRYVSIIIEDASDGDDSLATEQAEDAIIELGPGALPFLHSAMVDTLVKRDDQYLQNFETHYVSPERYRRNANNLSLALGNLTIPRAALTSRVIAIVTMDAYIPTHLGNLAEEVVGGPFRERTAIKHPVLFAKYRYLTDEYSMTPGMSGGSARMHSEFVLFTFEGKVRMTHAHWCHPTIEIDKYGSPTCVKRGQILHVSPVTFREITANAVYEVSFDCAATNPCSPSSKLIAAAIDYEGKIRFDIPRSTVSFEGKIDAFPAFRMSVENANYKKAVLFNEQPEISIIEKSPMNLPRDASRRIKKTVVIDMLVL